MSKIEIKITTPLYLKLVCIRLGGDVVSYPWLLKAHQLRSGKLVTVPSIDVNEWLGGSVSVVGKSDRTWLPRLSSRAWAADTAAEATERTDCVRSKLTNSVFITGLESLRATAVSCNCWMLAAALANPLAERDTPMWVCMVVAKLDWMVPALTPSEPVDESIESCMW